MGDRGRLALEPVQPQSSGFRTEKGCLSEQAKQRLALGQHERAVLQVVDQGVGIDAQAVVERGDQVLGRDGSVAG